MSLITRCPACGTMFKVVPDQLRISEGWVRCGHCAEVFDATAHLQGDEEGQPAAVAHSAAASRSAQVAHDPDSEAPPSSAPASDQFPSSLTTEIGEGLPSESPDSRQLREAAEALHEGPLDRPFVLQRQEADEPAAVQRSAKFVDSAHGPEPELHDLSFVKQARRKAFWTSAPLRVLLVLFLLALSALLAAQVALHDRDRLAATEPQLRPLLAMACERLNCSIGPPRQIDAISIDSSSFNKLRPDVYRLNVALRNQATMALAMPALELTLTDAQDQPLLRRVLAPVDLQPRREVIAAGGDWTGSIVLAVNANGAGARVAGYRVLAFYP